MVASTIAIAFAQADHKLIVVHCDLCQARLHGVFKTWIEDGVTSSLRDQSSLEQALLITEVSNLCALPPSGRHVPNAAETVQSGTFNRSLETPAEHVDSALVDSPLILMATDAVVIASRVDVTLVVMRAKCERRAAARRSARRLSEMCFTPVDTAPNEMEETFFNKARYCYGYYSKQAFSSRKEDAV